MLTRQNLVRGLTRVYVVLVSTGLLWLYLWVPSQVMEADARADALMRRPYDQRSWGQKYEHIVFHDASVWFHLLAVVVWPISGYLLMRAVVAIAFWVIDGFRARKT